MIGLLRAAVVAALGLFMAVAGAPVAHADFITDASVFDATNPGLTPLDFEGIAGPGSFDLLNSFSASNLTITSPTNRISISDSGTFFGTPTDTLFDDTFGGLITFDFGPGINAVGFNVGIGFSGGTGFFNVFNGADLLDTQSIIIANQNSMAGFVGWSGLGVITRITFATDSDDFPVIDNFRYGGALVAVPEPATIALFSAGLFGLGMIARRRKVA